MAVIDVQAIGKSYRQRGQAAVPVLRDISLRVEEGTVLGLLGPNGAGKTTLIKILAGLLAPDRGSGSVLGYNLLRQHREIRARVSLVAPTADVGIDNNLTVRQNLLFWAPVYGLQGQAARSRIDELLERLDLTGKADFWPMHISAGQRQRLALARSLLAHNRLVFLDEPTNKLDIEGVQSVRAMIADLNANHGVTVILTTHVMEEAQELCGEIALLRQGELVAHRKTVELTQSLGLTRPIRVTVELPLWPCGWQSELLALPAATGVHMENRETAGAALATFVVDSVDLRATTPALLAWLQRHALRPVSMHAAPVTLTDVFFALGGVRQEDMRGS
ncbi:MAG TPA: ABC transporter ATP-binding protein [Chloroflexota bacterium]|jgi:ABC-2 type transport system ATP-binding protein